MKTLTALRRAGYRGNAAVAKRTRARVQRHAWKTALPFGEPKPGARWLASFAVE
jgi:hypothetical protein